MGTPVLNLFFHGRIASMAPKLLSDDDRHVVIRPLAYCDELDIVNYAQTQAFPIIPCNLCGSQDNLQRQAVKNMLNDWRKRFPGRVQNIARALGDVRPAQLADRSLFDFAALGRTRDTPLPTDADWLRNEETDEM